MDYIERALSFIAFRAACLLAPVLYVRKLPGRLSPKWWTAPLALRPGSSEVRSWCRDLRDVFGEGGACVLLGVPVLTFRNWVKGERRASGASARGVWLVHALLLRPGLVSSAFDLVTWGRFKVERRALRKPCSDWSDWSV